MMTNDIYTTNLFTSPSMARGAARLMDLYGGMDEYNTDDNADCNALKNDWLNVGRSINDSINTYGGK